MRIRKAVFPVGGMGTRFLPATKATPKEMLPIVDKPLIQYAVEEAIAAGIQELIFITSSTKRAIEDHFDSNFELESKLEEQGKYDLLKVVHEILPSHIHCCYLRQRSPLGLGHAVLCAKEVVGNEAFAVLLADDLIDATPGCLTQMLEAYTQYNSSIIAVQEIERKDSDKYGMVDVESSSFSEKKLKSIVEKPLPEKAPSNLGVVGRYILTPRIFEFLATTPTGAGGEIQLTDAISALLSVEAVYAQQFHGRRYDCGSKLGYLEATFHFAQKHPELGEQVKKIFCSRDCQHKETQ